MEMTTPVQDRPDIAFAQTGNEVKRNASMDDAEFERFWDELDAEVRAQEAARRSATEPASAQAAEAQAEPEPELTFEEQCARVRTIVAEGRSSHREILRKILDFCRERRELGEVERQVQSYPEFAYAAQNPYRMIVYLVDCGGLRKLDLDEQGDVITTERTQGLTEDEIDDLILTYAFETTDAGKAVADELAPKSRLGKLLSAMPERAQTYLDVLQFCSEPQSMTAIDKLLGARDLSALKSLNTGSSVTLKPSVFVDKLERAGGIVWKDGWVITDAGRAYLEAAAPAVSA